MKMNKQVLVMSLVLGSLSSVVGTSVWATGQEACVRDPKKVTNQVKPETAEESGAAVKDAAHSGVARDKKPRKK